MAQGLRFSDDGAHYWDGFAWQLVSSDGLRWWDGSDWVEFTEAERAAARVTAEAGPRLVSSLD